MHVHQHKIHHGIILCPTNKFNINQEGINKKLYSHKKNYLSANKPVKGH